MKLMVDIELSFTVDEMNMISKAAELHKQTPPEYVAQVITNAYTKDLKRADRKPSKRIS
jgi:hypothetical protein